MDDVEEIMVCDHFAERTEVGIANGDHVGLRLFPHGVDMAIMSTEEAQTLVNQLTLLINRLTRSKIQ